VTALKNPDRGALISWSTAGGAAGDKKVHVKGDQFAMPGAGQFIGMDFAVMRDGTIYALTESDVKRIDPSGQVSIALAWARCRANWPAVKDRALAGSVDGGDRRSNIAQRLVVPDRRGWIAPEW